ncbi:cell division protein ZapA [Endozoicomonas numazuensis]|uniref:Cell division protein ZapA n=1 Tax=Endozoicomonas numazuensis TaxID=1137799 RepID=A0A081NLM6_9GAMM|nr:cell division protein ZapA [Endozoicomonas numazuensis]KEQ19349.1 cell division protein ZapA [Endozoicomonas numazuensis]
MDSPSTTTVSILDKEYLISCPKEEEANLHRAAQHLNEQMKQIRSGGVIGAERIAVMAALNISYELLQSKQQSLTDNSDAQEQIKQMLGKLDQALMSIES